MPEGTWHPEGFGARRDLAMEDFIFPEGTWHPKGFDARRDLAMEDFDAMEDFGAMEDLSAAGDFDFFHRTTAPAFRRTPSTMTVATAAADYRPPPPRLASLTEK